MQNQNIRALKAFVIILGLVIVVGLGAMLVAIGREVAGARGRGTAPFAPAAFSLPAGAKVLEMDLDGDRLAVRLELADGRQIIQLFDAGTGQALGAIALQPQR